jgi:hypothetical protein
LVFGNKNYSGYNKKYSDGPEYSCYLESDDYIVCTVSDSVQDRKFYWLSTIFSVSENIEYDSFEVTSDEFYTSISQTTSQNNYGSYNNVYLYVSSDDNKHYDEIVKIKFKILNELTEEDNIVFDDLSYIEDFNNTLYYNSDDVIITKSDLKTADTYSEAEITNYHLAISSDNLYVDSQEEKYKNYARETKVYDVENNLFYIEDGNIYYEKNNEKIKININNEKAKYLGKLVPCSAIPYILALTESGNVYVLNNLDTFEVLEDAILLYDGGDAEEILPINEDQIYATCTVSTLYVLVDNELYSISMKSKNIGENYGTREAVHQFSLAYSFTSSNTDWISASEYWSSVLLYPDGSLNKYIYGQHDNADIKSEFVLDDNGEKILVSYIYNSAGEIYFIDTNGVIYKIIGPDNYDEKEVLPFSVEKVNENKKVSYIDVEQKCYVSSDYCIDKSMVITFDDDSKQEIELS